MKTLQKTTMLGLAMSIAMSCTDPNQKALEKSAGSSAAKVQSNETTCTTFLLGDKDGFGTGMKDGDPLYLPGGTSLPLDWRNNDPAFTDVYPADIDANKNTTHRIRFTMEFTPPLGMETATFRLNTLGIQDGDGQVGGSNTDIKLYIDDEEVPYAFDSVDQFDLINGKWSDFVSVVEITVPSNMLHLLEDGKIELRWELLQLVPGMQSYDGFAIDYCELRMCVGDDR